MQLTKKQMNLASDIDDDIIRLWLRLPRRSRFSAGFVLCYISLPSFHSVFLPKISVKIPVHFSNLVFIIFGKKFSLNFPSNNEPSGNTTELM